MAEFNVDGRMKVKTLKAQFKEAIGATLRVYYKTHFADDDATLASIRGEGAKGGELKVAGNMKVGNFENKFKELFALEVKVANPANTALADKDVTLTAAGIETQSEEPTSDNKGKYRFNGQVYGTKGRLCHAIVKHYAEQNPKATFTTMQKTFNTSSNLIVATPDMALATTDSSGKAGGNYYMKAEDVIPVKNGSVVVWNYWPKNYYDPFMEAVKKIGYIVEEI